MNKILFILTVIVVAILGGKFTADLEGRRSQPPAIEQTPKQDVKADIEKFLAAENQKASVNERLIYQRFVRRMDAQLTAKFAKQPDRINNAVAALTGLEGTIKITAFSARDLVSKTDRASEFIASHTSPLFTPVISQSSAAIAQELRELHRELTRSSQNYFSTCGNHVNMEIREARLVLDPNLLNLDRIDYSKIQSAAVQTGLSASFLALDAVGARAIVRSAQRVLGPIIFRFAGSAKLAGLAVAIDGPIPLGDVLGLAMLAGCTVWIIHDLHQTRTQLVPEIRAKLTAESANLHKNIRESAMEQALQMIKAHEDVRTQFAEALTNAIDA